MQLNVVQTPNTPIQKGEAFYDIPFVYVLNYFYTKGANPAINGSGFAASAWADVIPSQGDYEFHLRRHMPSWSQNFNIYDTAQKTLYSPYDLNPTDVAFAQAMPGDALVIPEMIFPPGTGIRVRNSNGFQFDNLDTVWYGYYAMQGVKRIMKTPNRVPNYPYQERSFTYQLQVPSSLGVYPATQRYIILVQNYDFELQAIDYWSGYGTASTTNMPKMQVMIYDADQYPMMSDFTDIRLLQTGNSPQYEALGCFPTPPVIYPRGSRIVVDVRSLATTQTNNTAAQQTLNFIGVNRTPC